MTYAATGSMGSGTLKMAEIRVWEEFHTELIPFQDVQLGAYIWWCVKEDNSLVS